MASRDQGRANVKQLLEAEERASKIVLDAKKDRVRRLRQAEEEAQRDIEDYRTQRETRYQAFRARAQIDQDKIDEMDLDLKAELQRIDDTVAQSEEQVVKMLIDRVMQVSLD